MTAIDGWVARTRQPFSWEVQDNTDQFLVPYSGRGIDVWKDS